MLEFTSKAKEELSNLRKQISLLKTSILNFEEKEACYENQISIKEAEIQRLKQRINDSSHYLDRRSYLDDYKNEMSPEKTRISIENPFTPVVCLTTLGSSTITPRKNHETSFESDISTINITREDFRLNIANISKSHAEDDLKSDLKRKYEQKLAQLREDYKEINAKLKEVDEDRCKIQYENRNLSAEIKQSK